MATKLENLERRSFVRVEGVAEWHQSLHDLLCPWEQFCGFRSEVKRIIGYSDYSAGVGYEGKDLDGEHSDRKENFDVTRAGLPWLEKWGIEAGNPIIRRLIERSTGVLDLINPLVIQFAEDCEEEFGLDGFGANVRQSADHCFLRLLHYPAGERPGGVMATAHADQSGFTLHLYESSPGLQYLSYGGSWIELPVSDTCPTILTGMQLQLTSRGKLRALWHRVKTQMPEAGEPDRYSAVCFVQLQGTPRYDKGKWGRIQEMEPGFNYGLNGEQFSRFFKQTEVAVA